jgi:hypothetical protein
VVNYDVTAGAVVVAGDTVACNLVAGSVEVGNYDETSGAEVVAGAGHLLHLLDLAFTVDVGRVPSTPDRVINSTAIGFKLDDSTLSA